MWTIFTDSHSGGKQKLEWEIILLEVGEKHAPSFFEELFGRDPDHITCSCCGSDYSWDEYETIEKATGYYRNCDYKIGEGYVESPSPDCKKYKWEYITVEQLLERGYENKKIKVVYKDELKALYQKKVDDIFGD